MTADSTGSSTPPIAALRNERFASQPDLTGVLAGKATLGTGAKGPGVRAVQQALADMGFSLHGGADGAFGPQSAKAVRNFQTHARSAFPEVQPTGVVDAATLRALDALAPAPGQRSQTQHLPAPRYKGTPVRVVVVKDEHRTYLFDPQGQLQGLFGNAVGARHTKTDSGLKKVTGKLNEAQAHALGKKLWGGPVFGPRLIDLSWADGSRSGEELHGTNAPAQLGQDVSHGCIRHDDAAILALYDALQVGDMVAIVDSVNDPHLGAAPTTPTEKPDLSGAVAARK
ncbi:peptidoglycan-binding protein [Archangium violaceum]|uniref:L,D-transpeptidase family protein n=1 Tax=Archangium violaceum TaxID=83451 RepID=UPI00193B2594|nr:L,D-transpeptidase family protein [Archangium violaceum]QRK12742.1 peptidoglycan-binding protein [Archangium violaceum]